MMLITSLQSILERVKHNSPKSETAIIGIDGGGAAGKSTIASKFKELDQRIEIIHMDDFYKPVAERGLAHPEEVGAFWDWRRVIDQVLEPLKNHRIAKYQIYDWNKDALTDWVTVMPGHVVIVEGCYCLRKEMVDYYDLKIWMESPRDLRLSRGIDRDGEQKRPYWDDIWMPEEDRYVDLQNPRSFVDYIIDGTGSKADINKYEVFIMKVAD